jgi:hypothetical protein
MKEKEEREEEVELKFIPWNAEFHKERFDVQYANVEYH